MKVTIDTVANPVGERVRGLLFDDRPFIWGVLKESLVKCRQACLDDPGLLRPVHKDIHDHFLKSLGAFLNRPITIQELNQAIASQEVNL